VQDQTERNGDVDCRGDEVLDSVCVSVSVSVSVYVSLCVHVCTHVALFASHSTPGPLRVSGAIRSLVKQIDVAMEKAIRCVSVCVYVCACVHVQHSHYKICAHACSSIPPSNLTVNHPPPPPQLRRVRARLGRPCVSVRMQAALLLACVFLTLCFGACRSCFDACVCVLESYVVVCGCLCVFSSSLPLAAIRSGSAPTLPRCRFILRSVEEGDKALKQHTLFQDFSDLAA